MHEESRKNQSVTEWCGCGKLGVMDTLGMRYGDTNAVAERI